MKFEKAKMVDTIKFELIREGELFKFCNKIFMRIEAVTGSLTSDDEYDEWEFNAVNIENGEVHCVHDFEQVERVKYKLEISE